MNLFHLLRLIVRKIRYTGATLMSSGRVSVSDLDLTDPVRCSEDADDPVQCSECADDPVQCREGADDPVQCSECAGDACAFLSDDQRAAETDEVVVKVYRKR